MTFDCLCSILVFKLRLWPRFKSNCGLASLPLLVLLQFQLGFVSKMGGSYLWAYLNCPFEIIDTGDISLFMFCKSHVNEKKFVVGAKTC